MAKVDGPLFSLEARGKVGDAMVFFPWKGRHVVRQWLKPTNVKSSSQGYVRAILKTIGKWIKKVGNTNDGDANDSVIYQAGTASAPAGQNWNAYLARGFLDACQTGGELATGKFDAFVTEYSNIPATDQTEWQAQANSLGISNFAFNYGYTNTIEAGFQLYAGALAAYSHGIIGTGIYNTTPKSWADTDIQEFRTDHEAAT